MSFNSLLVIHKRDRTSTRPDSKETRSHFLWAWGIGHGVVKLPCHMAVEAGYGWKN
ncbi:MULTISPECIES: hypothetical protein [Calothrix]|uniref:Uncharacterized protein n=2 Tax=Calothrix TaxID=1186 RepID=A0ABR8AD47_9CYAN|nr:MULTISPECIES: hypothetical protein [Calothrix]MBD2197937.1 hypothetical protein [Calothrix parietina FACHB-288]MBD2226778.1 hypothetical protein [Calothrix anomala FACHB-343]